jgi:hypothetical protein
MAFPFVYGFALLFKMPALVYSSQFMAFFANPHMGYVVVGFWKDDFG